MNWQDLINSVFELGSGFAVGLHCRRLFIDKHVKGASMSATIFFSAFGLWNLYYYPYLDQWVSFFGGISVATANVVWISMMIYYTRFPGGCPSRVFNQQLRINLGPYRTDDVE